MWQQNYTAVAGSVGLTALTAGFPILVLLIMIGVFRKAAWLSSVMGLAGALLVAIAVFGMPAGLAFTSIAYGAASGLFPIGWVVFTAILLYNITVDTGKFEIVKRSIANLTDDRRLQALLIAFAFGAFIEGAAGFGTPVAVAASMLTGLGFSPFFAGGICLLANTAPVAFGSIATPLITLASTTKLPLMQLGAGVGRICAPVSLIIPAYLIVVMGGWKALRGVLPAAAICGLTFAGVQLGVSNFIGPELTDILSSLSAIGVLVVLLRVWRPKDTFQLEGDGPAHPWTSIRLGEALHAWTPFVLLVVCVLFWTYKPVQTWMVSLAIRFPWPGLHNIVQKMPPVTTAQAPYDAMYTFPWLSASGTSCLVAALLSAAVLGVSPARFFRILGKSARQLVFAELTIAVVMALAFLMNYSGATATMGLAFARTGGLFPFFSALLGWIGVFLTGSDTSANALFGNLQVVTAQRLGMNPVLMAASNSSGGVMGKMISLQSIAVAAAATSAGTGKEEGRLFRFTLKHSILLASLIGLIVMFYAYAGKSLAP
ncbi:MAG TPA: lactate permease LctP family transporter [Bryobacteraceae bacterium]|nr:lactate permease LctP family transporter [Bryobacteraceae bacterium]